MSWVLGLLCLSLVAVFTSQSLVDLADILVVGTAIYTAYKNREFKKMFTDFKPAWLWPVWILIIIVGLVLNTDLKTAAPWQDFFEFRWILTFLSWIYLLQHLKDQKKIFKFLGILLLILNFAALLYWFKDTEARAGGLLKTSMAFAHNIAPILCLFGILMFTNWKNYLVKEKILHSLVVFTSGTLVVITFTRGVWIGTAAGLLFTTLIWNRKAFAGVIAVLILVFLIGTNASQRFSNRVFTKTALETESNNERTALWRGNWEMIKDYPIFGVGLGANKSHLRKYYDIFGYPESQRQSHAHNQYLQYWAGTGTLGLICYLGFLFLILRYSYQSFKNSEDLKIRNLQLGLLAALICYLVGSLTESNFNIAKNRFLFLLLAAMAVAWSISDKKLPAQRGKNWD